MLRNLMLGAAAVALVALANPAGAQVALPDVEIEGPMTYVHAFPAVVDPVSGRRIIGEMKVMGARVKVLETALVHTPGAASTDVASAIALLDGFSGTATPLPGRSSGGFIGGTAIVIGESFSGVIYASDVFSDMFENVIVGEATGRVEVTGETVKRMSINGMPIIRSTDSRLLAGPPINGLGLRIKPNSIVDGTLVAAEGYYSSDKNMLYYHALEADSAELANTEDTQVGILRADCRVRGGGRDEIQVRGGVANPGDATVQIRIPDPTPNNPNRFTTIGLVTAVPVAGTNPPQGQFDADFRNLTIPGGVCPTRVRAVILATSPGALNQATATADMDGR
jgi:hypothetical protein